MKRSEDNNWLDEALTEAIHSDRSTTDFDKWKENHPQAVEMLTSRAKESPKAAESPLRIWRITMTKNRFKLAAAAVILIAALIGLTPFLGGTVTFAQVVKPILDARTLVFDLVIGNDESGVVMHEEVSGSLIRRTISNIPNMVMMIDMENNKMLALDNTQNTAGYVDLGHLANKTENYIDSIRKIIIDLQNGLDIEQLPEQQIYGKTAVGFKGVNKTGTIIIWADPDTALPIKIELQRGHFPAIFKNFQFDPQIEQISMEIPAGYTQDKQEQTLSDASEQDLVGSLRTWAKFLADGVFPDKVGTDTYMKQIGLLGQKIPTMDIPDSQKEQVGFQFAKGMIFLQTFETTRNWAYTGKGVKLGDAEKVILWYQPEGSTTYRAIYGDLRAADIAKEDLPK